MSDRDALDPGSRYLALSRRAFLGRAGLLTGGLIALGPGGLLRPGRAEAQLEKAGARMFATGSSVLTLNGATAGYLQSFEGGTARGDVINEPLGAGGVIKKHVGPPRFEPIKFRAGIGSMTQPFYDLLDATLTGKHVRANGSIVMTDFNGNTMRQVDFTNALVSELTFPALDAAAKEMAYVDVTLDPEQTRWSDAKGDKTASDLIKGQKKTLLSNFRLSIAGAENACKRVNKVEALTVKQTSVRDEIGAARDFAKEPGKLEIPNLVFTLPESDAAELQTWYKSFLLDGKNGDDQERSGTLELMSPDLATVLFALNFSQLGIFALSRVPAQGGDAVARVKAELYCESISCKGAVAKA